MIFKSNDELIDFIKTSELNITDDIKVNIKDFWNNLKTIEDKFNLLQELWKQCHSKYNTIDDKTILLFFGFGDIISEDGDGDNYLLKIINEKFNSK